MKVMIRSKQHLFYYQNRFSVIGILFSFIFFLIFITLSFATDVKEVSARYEKLSNELRCPTCQGLSVKDSDAGFSVSIKDKIRELIQQGKSDQEILDFFVERYGEWILRSPTKSGFNLILWILPVAGIFFGLIFVIIYSRSRVNTLKNDNLSLTPDEEKRVEEDLKRFKTG